MKISKIRKVLQGRRNKRLMEMAGTGKFSATVFWQIY